MMATGSLGPRVLIVEDHADTADMLGRYARLLNCETRICGNGKEALEKADEFLPQIILLDIGLPDMDGWDLAKTLKDKLDPVHPVIIAITGLTSYEDREKSRQVGVDHYLVKPSYRDDLMRLLMQLVGSRR
jgi:DNA-binding response OmpR family regulator